MKGVTDVNGTVVAVSSNGEYSFTKPNRDCITLLAGLGVEGDVHAGVTGAASAIGSGLT
jgi:hypothetical protein